MSVLVGGRRSRLLGASEFSPLDVESLEMWLDAQVTASMDDGEGSPPVEGVPVDTWTDLVNSYAFDDAGDVSFRPTYRADGLNGLPCLEFDGLGNGLRKATNIAMGPSPLTIAAVIEADAVGLGLIFGRVGSSQAGWGLFANTSTIRFATTDVKSYDFAASSSSPQVVIARLDTAHDVTLYVNGVEIGTVAHDAGMNATTSQPWVGGRNGTTSLFTGKIGELVWARADLVANGQIGKLSTYLMRKWSL